MAPMFFALFSILIGVHRADGSSSSLFSDCSGSFSCGNITGITFPFWGGNRPRGCGYPALELTCEGNEAFFTAADVKYIVKRVDSEAQILGIARQDLSNGVCLKKFVNTTIDPALFKLVPGYTNYSFMYGCPSTSNSVLYPIQYFNCSGDGLDCYVLPEATVPSSCSANVVVPVSVDMYSAYGGYGSSADVGSMLQEGFEVKLKVDGEACNECLRTNGACGYDPIKNETTCYCLGKSSGSKSCSSSASSSPAAPQGQPPTSTAKKYKISPGLGIAIGCAGVVLILLALWLLLLFRKNRSKRSSFMKTVKQLRPASSSKKSLLVSASSFSRSVPSDPSSKSEPGNRSTYFGLPVFSYQELEEATYNFDTSRELGDGGFGTVYHGKLRDGRDVAVKRLYEHNLKRLEQFTNELEILTRLQHPNLVKLHGCTSRRSQELLLVYEFIPNGTVADHLFGKSRAATSSGGHLPWRARLDIAVQTADALAYLHTSDVIHRDVKTNNILLDESFGVKVADFGLSRLFPTDVTHVSTAPQGTPGYVDPEYYQCYRLTDKSDVYSFGVVLCELMSSKPAVDTNRHRHDINLANMAIDRIMNGKLHELVDPDLRFDTDDTVRRTVTQVAELAFRCLQQDREVRPAMAEVVENLRAIQDNRAEVIGEVLDSLRGIGGVVEKAASVRTWKPEVIDIRSDDVGLLRNAPPPLSPDSAEWGGPPHNSV